MDEVIKAYDEIWVKAKVIGYRADTKKVWATVFSHLGSTKDDWFEEGQYALPSPPQPVMSEEEIEKILEKQGVSVGFAEHVDSDEDWERNCKEHRKKIAHALSGKITQPQPPCPVYKPILPEGKIEPIAYTEIDSNWYRNFLLITDTINKIVEAINARRRERKI